MSESLEERFLTACGKLNVEEISACLTLKVDINTVDIHGFTGLMICVYRASSQACDNCLDRILQQPGLDINKQTYYQATALHLVTERATTLPY